MTKELKSKIVWQNDKDFGKVCTLTESSLDGIITEATKELEEKISILLSCKNCLENKGGLLCQKEYEDKCLSQKIQFIKELQEENAEFEGKLQRAENLNYQDDKLIKEYSDRIAELEARNEKLINFVLSKTECCDVCPITDTCINSEGTCPYAGILSKGEEAVTREWLMQKITKEIKEK